VSYKNPTVGAAKTNEGTIREVRDWPKSLDQFPLSGRGWSSHVRRERERERERKPDNSLGQFNPDIKNNPFDSPSALDAREPALEIRQPSRKLPFVAAATATAFVPSTTVLIQSVDWLLHGMSQTYFFSRKLENATIPFAIARYLDS